METPELIIISINLIIHFLGYLVIYPRLAGSNIKKLGTHTILSNLVALLVCGSLFWDTGIEFNLILFSVNWFWFCMTTYLAIDFPFSLYYMKQYNIDPDAD
ncbi:MAG: hypothetical protein AAFP10_07520 [Pseudomonadota bacterium]